MPAKSTKKTPTPRRTLSPRDASVLALLVQIPDGLSWTQEMRDRLLKRLSAEAREIGDAIVADDVSFRSFSSRAQETAGEIKKWASSFPKKTAVA